MTSAAIVEALSQLPADWWPQRALSPHSTRRVPQQRAMSKFPYIFGPGSELDLRRWLVANTSAAVADPLLFQYALDLIVRAVPEDTVTRSVFSLMRYQVVASAVSAATCALALADFLAWLLAGRQFLHPIIDLSIAMASGGLFLSVLASQKYLEERHGKGL